MSGYVDHVNPYENKITVLAQSKDGLWFTPDRENPTAHIHIDGYWEVPFKVLPADQIVAYKVYLMPNSGIVAVLKGETDLPSNINLSAYYEYDVVFPGGVPSETSSRN